jgi:hypothetical protein
MMKHNLILAAALVFASVAPASAVVCTASGFEGGIPSVVSTLTIDDGAGNTVDITDFSTTLVTNSDPDNSSAVIVYDEFKFGSTAQAQISAAGLSLTTGTIIKGASGDLTAEVTCD